MAGAGAAAPAAVIGVVKLESVAVGGAAVVVVETIAPPLIAAVAGIFAAAERESLEELAAPSPSLAASVVEVEEETTGPRVDAEEVAAESTDASSTVAAVGAAAIAVAAVACSAAVALALRDDTSTPSVP